MHSAACLELYGYYGYIQQTLGAASRRQRDSRAKTHRYPLPPWRRNQTAPPLRITSGDDFCRVWCRHHL